MRCGHCCYSCGPIGTEMPFEMFKTILDKWGSRLQEANYYITIGGGEPTIHPDFWKIIDYSLKYGHPWLCTNGKLRDFALKLADLSRKNVLTAVLSLDKWHDPIEQCVIDAFKKDMVKKKNSWGEHWTSKIKGDNRQIRTVKSQYKVGFSKTGIENCCCRQIQIQPTGHITMCGCDDAPVIGTVEEGFSEKYNSIPWYGGCHKYGNKSYSNSLLNNLKIFLSNRN